MNTQTTQWCVLCQGTIDIQCQGVQIQEKGSQRINEASKERGDRLQTNSGDFVHINCRKLYTNPNLIKKAQRETAERLNEPARGDPTPILRSHSNFNFSCHCLFCGQNAKLHSKKRGNDVFPVRTSDFQKSILHICDERDDDWAAEVRGRIESVNDLHAAAAVYHQPCNVNFKTRKAIPQAFTPDQQIEKKLKKKGRPSMTFDYFQEVIQYLKENEDEQLTIADLVDKMAESCGELAYSTIYMKKKLKEHFGDDVLITEINGKSSVVTLRRTAESILQEFYQTPKENFEDERCAIIKTAAKLIKNEIKSVNVSKDHYPSASEISDLDTNLKFVPDSLINLLKSLFSEKDSSLKTAAIGQAIMQATRPRVLLSPLQIGLGVQLHHHFGSRYLIDTCHSLGFCVPYTEVQRYTSCAAVSDGTFIEGVFPESCFQFVADNVDHNVRTLDGHDTFQGMGIIAGVTPGAYTSKPISRTSVTSDDLIQLGKIEIQHYKQPTNRMSTLSFAVLKDMQKMDSILKLDSFTKLVWPLKSPMPGWTGLMQMVQSRTHLGKSSFTFLPIIDMSPSDMSCIYSTLRFIYKQACRYDKTPIVTFDQPLYWKAFIIISNEDQDSGLRSIILRLGGFHLEMSFLGAVGHIMNGSGLQQLLETVYSPNAVLHMLTGKAVARALRGQMLVDIAIHAFLVSMVFGVKLPVDTLENNDIDDVPEIKEAASASLEHNTGILKQLGDLYDQLVGGDISIDNLCENSTLVEALDLLAKQINTFIFSDDSDHSIVHQG